MGALLLSLVASGAVAADTFGDPLASSSRAEPPGGILVGTNRSRCYGPNSHISVTVRNLTAGTSTLASSDETVSVGASASATGTAIITITAPSALPHGRRIEAHLVEVVGTDATGSVVGANTAFVFGTKRVCKTLNGR
jgi:hypothetical protein